MLADNCSVCDGLNDYVGGQLFFLRWAQLLCWLTTVLFAIGSMIMLADNCSVCDTLNNYVGGQLFCLR